MKTFGTKMIICMENYILHRPETTPNMKCGKMAKK